MHARSIERRLPRFNAKLVLSGLLLLAGPATATEVPGSAGRLDVGGYLDGVAVVETEDSVAQSPGALLDLRVDARVAAALRGHLELRTRIGGPFEGGHPGIYDLVHEFQNRTPSLEASEAYVDWHLRRADVRVGIQKVAWGKLDGIAPTDVVNPRDFHDPLVDDAEERKIGVPAVLGTYYLPDVPRVDLSALRVSLMYVPIAMPSRLALVEERWFPNSIAPTFNFHGIPVHFRTLNNRPPAQLDAGAVALRLGGTWRDMDWDVYHYTGPETGPDADIISTVFFSTSPADVMHGILPHLRVDTRLRQAFDSMHMTGGDWSAAVGGATLRAEAAVFQNRPYLRVGSDLAPSNPEVKRLQGTIGKRIGNDKFKGSLPVRMGDLFVDRDSIEWGVGADYLWNGFIPLLQLNQIALFESAPRLLIADPETRLTASLRKRLLAERLELEVRGIYAIERGGWFLFPRATYALRDDLRLRVGYLALGGSRNSLIGQFGQNDEVVLQARYSF